MRMVKDMAWIKKQTGGVQQAMPVLFSAEYVRHCKIVFIYHC